MPGPSGRGPGAGKAPGIYCEIGERGREAGPSTGPGHCRACADLRQDGSCHQQALDQAGQIGSSREEAHALAGLGRYALAAGRTASETRA